MTVALRSLLSQILDYAGLFPPAALALNDAIRNHARYIQSPDRWMLGRFICPAPRLVELLPYLDSLFASSTEPLAISSLGRGGKDSLDFVANLEADLAAVQNFQRRAGTRAVVDVLETRGFSDPRENESFAAHLAGACQSLQLRGFVEVPSSSSAGLQDIQAMQHNAQLLASHGLGYKLRTGGTEASAFPSASIVARAVLACRSAKCPIKFTAGLHHPLPRFDAGIGATMHGFINVFLVGVMAHTHGLDEHAVVEILQNSNPDDFTFDDYTIRYRTLNATLQRIEQTRTAGLTSFGSCSFNEPREDLRQLGWWNTTADDVATD